MSEIKEDSLETTTVSPESFKRLEEKLNEILKENTKLKEELQETKSSLNDVHKTLNDSGLSTLTDDESNVAVSIVRRLRPPSFKKSLVALDRSADSAILVTRSFAADANEIESDNIDDSGAAYASSKKSRGIIVGFFRKLSKLLKTNIELSNTNTIHMYCVALHFPSNRESFVIMEKVKAWSFALFSLLTIVLQIWSLSYIVWEASHPTCSTHGDCNAGLFCNMNTIFDDPRCSDCSWRQTKYYFDNCHGVHLELWKQDLDDLSYSRLWYEKTKYNGTRVHMKPKVNEILKTNSTLNHTEQAKCLEYHYCAESKLAQFPYPDDKNNWEFEEPVCPFFAHEFANVDS